MNAAMAIAIIVVVGIILGYFAYHLKKKKEK